MTYFQKPSKKMKLTPFRSRVFTGHDVRGEQVKNPELLEAKKRSQMRKRIALAAYERYQERHDFKITFNKEGKPGFVTKNKKNGRFTRLEFPQTILS